MTLTISMATIEHDGLSSASLSPAVRSVDGQAFKDGMAGLAFSIAVVTAIDEEGPVGRTVTSFMPLSAEPPRLVVSIDGRSRLAAAIRACQTFSISFLSGGQHAVGDTFAGKHPAVERFTVGDWGRWPSGNPRLLDASFGLDCRVSTVVDTGEHTLFVGVLVEAETSAAPPLVWHGRRYRRLEGSGRSKGVPPLRNT